MAATASLRLLVPTKLTMPQQRSGWIVRPRLLARLGTQPSARLTMIVAPAGFGKSTLAAQWLLGQPPVVAEHDEDDLLFPLPGATQARQRVAWLSLDEHDQDPLRLLAYLASALERAVPGALPATIDLLTGSELRAADLRFTPAESVDLLAALRGDSPAPGLAATLHQQTEGWAIALQLAALATTNGSPIEQARGTAGRQIAEYLADEVLAQQPEAIQHLLLVLAIPERFCAELCAALLDKPDERALAAIRLEQLVEADLFLSALGYEGRWYRFHPLFRELLRRRLQLAVGEGEVRALQERAARWLAAEGLIEEAVRLFLAGGNTSAAAELVEQTILREMVRDARNANLIQWMRLLPVGTSESRPGLMLMAARVASMRLDLAALHDALMRADALLAEAGRQPPPWAGLLADRAALWAILSYWRGEPTQALELLQPALAEGSQLISRVQLCMFMALAAVGASPDAESGELIERQLAAAASLGVVSPHAQATFHCSVALLRGQIDRLTQHANRLSELIGEREKDGPATSFVNYCLGVAAYERSNLVAAAGHFAVIARLKRQVNDTTYASGMIGGALTALAMGARDEAELYVDELRGYAAEAGGIFLRNQALGCTARLALVRGDLQGALAAAWEITPDIHLGASIWFELPRLTKAQVLIAQGDRASLAQADAIVGACLAQLEPLHNIRPLVMALGLQALVRQAQGRSADALVMLRRAVSLAAPRCLLRSLYDLGSPLREPLAALRDQGVAPDYLGRLLALEGLVEPPLRPVPLVRASQQLPEQLTRREAEVLALLAERWSNQDIAERLVLSINTVRKHTSTIYDKFGVNSRREAVATARALGILPPE